MIGSLKGTLTIKQAPSIIVECAGVGYQVETPMSTFLDLPPPGGEVFLHTHLVVREDAHTLYGFATVEEKSLFRLLLKISGVGAKMALAILSGMSVGDFQRCVRYDDTAMLIRIPGVGKKTAERLIVEMRDKIDASAEQPLASGGATAAGDSRSEAVDALVALGYKPAEIKRLLAKLDTRDKSAEDIIRLALRQVAA
ncbi:MAG: Holliday junction branch migration protein RuvA [Woeseiaceae bacterium]|nr:Holliday junction branch migration protein RuvA [Woeseiaceae bacterium]